MKKLTVCLLLLSLLTMPVWAEESDYAAAEAEILKPAVTGTATSPTLKETIVLDAAGNELRRDVYEVEDTVEYQYDEMGNVTLVKTADGCTEYGYNRAGNLIARYKYDSGGGFLFGREYDYDAEGNRILEKQYLTENRTNHWYVNKFNKGGNMISQTDYFSDGETIRSHEAWHYSEYDYDFLIKRLYTEYEDGLPASRTEYQYNHLGEILRQYNYAIDGKNETLLSAIEWTRKYDDDRPVYAAKYVDGVLQGEQWWEYNADGRLTAIQLTLDDVLYYDLRCEYDDAGRLLRQSLYDLNEGLNWGSDAFVSDTIFSYDAAGNLVFEVERTNDRVSCTAYGAYGNVLWEQSSDMQGKVLNRHDYFYDETGTLTHERHSSGVVTYYDPDGNVIREIMADGTQYVYIYE